MCPFKVEKCLKAIYNIDRENINANTKGYIVKVDAEQTDKLLNVTSLLGVPYSVTMHRQFNESKGLIYMQEYDITNIESFKAGLMRDSEVKDVILATWITPKSLESKPFLITFNRCTPPQSMKIPGEVDNLRIYDYKEKPLFCTSCLEYTHSKRKCKNGVRCMLCAGPHLNKEYKEKSPKCFHCNQEHQVRDPRCLIQQQQEEICSIQSRDKIPWVLARQKFLARRPDGAQSYAEIAKKSTARSQLLQQTKKDGSRVRCDQQREKDIEPDNKRVKVLVRRKREDSEESTQDVQIKRSNGEQRRVIWRVKM